MRQPMLAPAAFGGSVVAGVAAALVSGYRIVDCFQYRSGPGACDEVIEDNTLPLVAGVAAILGSFGGFYTFNEQLESPAARRRRSDDPDPEPEPEPIAGLVDDPDQEPPDERIKVARMLRSQGLTQQEIAAELGVSCSTVQRLLQQ